MPKLPEETQNQLPLRKSSKPLRHLKNGAEPVSSNEIWLLTLSDLLMLLMIFFVFMLAVPYANSSNPQPSEAMASETQQPGTAVKPVEKNSSGPTDDQAAAMLEQDLQAALAGGEEEKGVTIERLPHAVIVTFPEQILFDSGQAKLKPTARPTLTAVAEFIAGHPELSIEVQGHTDDRPIRNSRYPSNWELSADRAIQVAKVLVQRGADPVKIATKGLGEFHPAAPNTSDDGRFKNRRVEIQFSL